MQPENIAKLIIIGSGPAGLTAAIYAARANLAPIVIEGSNPGGQLMKTTFVENWPGQTKIFGSDLMMKMKEHTELFGTRFISDSVIKVDFTNKPFTIFTNASTFKAHSIIICTGASPKKLNVPGEEQYWAKGVTVCAVCDGAFFKNVPVVIVGGGDSAMEDASFMTKFTDDITIVQIEDKLTASHIMQQRVLNNPKIKIIYKSVINQIKGNDNKVTEVEVKNLSTGQISTLKANAVFLAIGSTPNTAVFKNQLELNKYGYIQLKEQTKTSIEGVFCAGDVTDSRYRQAIVSAGLGCQASLDAERYLANLGL